MTGTKVTCLSNLIVGCCVIVGIVTSWSDIINLNKIK